MRIGHRKPITQRRNKSIPYDQLSVENLVVLLLFRVWPMDDAFPKTDCRVPTDRILSSVVQVVGDDGSQASGVVIGQDTVLTAAHVTKDSDSVYIKAGGMLSKATIRTMDPINDLAVLHVPTNKLPAIPFSMHDLNSHEQVWAIGFPLGGDLVMSSGRFAEIVNGTLRTSAQIHSGHSGGGLISCEDNKHVLAGMLKSFAAYYDGSDYIRIENLSMSVPTHIIESFLLH